MEKGHSSQNAYVPEEMSTLRQLSLPNLVDAEFGWVQKKHNAGEVEVTVATHIRAPKGALIELIKQREIKAKYWKNPSEELARKLLKEETEKYIAGEYRKILPAKVQDLLHYIIGLKVENSENSPYFHSDPTHTIKFKETSTGTKCLIKFIVPHAPNPKPLEEIYSEGDLYFVGHIPSEVEESVEEHVYARENGIEIGQEIKRLENEKRRIEEEIKRRLENKEASAMGREEIARLNKEKKNLEKQIKEALEETEEKRRKIMDTIKSEDKNYIFNFGLILQAQASESYFNMFKNSLLEQIKDKAELFLDRKRYAESPDSTKVRIQEIYRIENPTRVFAKEIISDMANEQLILTPEKKLGEIRLDYEDAYVGGEEGIRAQIKARGKRKIYNMGVECVNKYRLDYEVLGGELLMPIMAWNKNKNEFFYITLVPWYPTLKDESLKWDWIDRILEGRSLWPYVSSLATQKQDSVRNFFRKLFCIGEESKGLYLGSQIFTVRGADEEAIENVFNNGKYSLLPSQYKLFRAAQ